MKVVAFPTTGTVLNAMLALDKANHPRVLMVTGADILYASCDASCGAPASWQVTTILNHRGERDVTGKAFALDAQGRPRFIMHTPIAYLGFGQKPPASEWVSCDASCGDAASWTHSKFSDQMWTHNSLAFDAQNRAHLATIARVADSTSIAMVGAYATCAASCGTAGAWNSTGFGPAFSSEIEAVSIREQTALALTQSGAPRIALMLPGAAQGQRKLAYFTCSAADCSKDGAWSGIAVIDSTSKLDLGFDLRLDAKDRPRIALTMDYNIAIASCDAADCTANGATWKPTFVENSNDIPTDQIFLYPNCSVGAWLLHSPSLALTPSGAPRVAYTARDVSAGGVYPTDPHGPRCTAGTDMLLARMAVLK